MSSADLVVDESAFHAGAILVLKVNFLTFVFIILNEGILGANLNFCVRGFMCGCGRLTNRRKTKTPSAW